MDQSTCRWPDCDRSKILARGLCSKHYAQERRAGLHGTPQCRWPDCHNASESRGFCSTCLKRAEKVGDYAKPWTVWQDARRPPAKPCRWPDCDSSSRGGGRGYCPKHYQRARRLSDYDSPWAKWVRHCLECGSLIQGRNRTQRFCSDSCIIRSWKQRNVERFRELGRRHAARRRALILGTTVERFTEQDVRDRTGDDCYLCGHAIDFQLRWPDPMSPSLDHILPLSKGGMHTLDNTAMTHLRCNHAKNDRVLGVAPQKV